jgi:RND family efflux transporter MFP subunit
MRAKRTDIAILQLCVLIALVVVLYRLSIHEQWIPTAMTGDNDEDDQKYVAIVPVSIGPVVRTTLRSYLDAYGTVEPQPARSGAPAGGANVNSPTPALVGSVDVVEGQQVKAGQIVFRLDDRAILAAIAREKANVESAERTAKEFDDALNAKSVPQAQVLRARANRDIAKASLAAAEAQQALLTFTAPVDGVVTQLRIHAGESTPINLPAVDLVDPTRLVVALQVPLWQLQELKVGDGAILRQNRTPTTRPTSQPTSQPAPDAVVTYIDPQIDPRTGLGQVDVSIPASGDYRVGQFVALRIIVGQHDNCLAVPEASIVQNRRGNPTLSVVERDYHWAFRRVVQLGIRDNGFVEVRDSDLKAGQSVVTTGSYALSDQCQIEVTP